MPIAFGQVSPRIKTKGTFNQPFVASSPLVLSGTPSSYVLSYSNPVETTWEPSSGCCSNFGSGSASYDDAQHYYSAGAFFDLCGPGASDIVLYYWPLPPSIINNANVYDNWDGATTTWNAQDVDSVWRMRGYMMKLAWQIHAPSWASGANGMMNAQPRSSAVWLQVVRDGLNWEASGENSSTWTNYFYVVAWWNQLNQGILHDDVVSDTYYNNVPVVAEVNAQMMPNWTNHGGRTNHFITIIGYDDVHSTFYYTDTCASSTSCGSNYDGQVHTVSQSQMWNAITNIPVNQSTGDGGWVW